MQVQDVPTKTAFMDAVIPAAHPYRRRLKGSSAYGGIGMCARWLYLASKEWDARYRARRMLDREVRPVPTHPVSRYLKDIRAAYRVGGVVGSAIRVVDDILDGHACTPLSRTDREAFATGFIHAVETGEQLAGPAHDLVPAAYTGGAILHEMIGDPAVLQDVVERLEAMRTLTVSEDKSTIEGYREALQADSAHYTALIVDAMQVLPTFAPTDRFYEMVLDFGAVYGVVDDLFDEDITVPRQELEDLHAEAYARFARHPGLLVGFVRLCSRSTRPYAATITCKRVENRIRTLIDRIREHAVA